MIKFKRELYEPGLLPKYIERLTKLKNYILEASSSDIAFDRIKELYQFAKDISKECCLGEDPERISYFKIAEFINLTDSLLPKERLCRQTIKQLNQKEPSTTSEPEEILDYLVSKTRAFLFMKRGHKDCQFVDLDLSNLCKDSAFYIHDIARTLNISAKVKIIEPGFLFSSYLYGGFGSHCFTLLYFDDRTFLVDCTYSQFFYVRRCLFERTGMMLSLNSSPAFFMEKDRRRWQVAKKILDDGWIELKDDELKSYLDGFTMFYRNGLYYENTNDFSFTTPYTVEDYMRFLSFDDDLLEHEPEDTLGYQLKPLKNPRMKLPH